MDKPKILIVEDDIPVLDRLERFVGRMVDADIRKASQGDQAAEMMIEQDFDLVILDVKMPGMNGLDVMRVVKKRRTLPDILVVTAWDSMQVAEEAFAEGAQDYLPKPIDVYTMQKKIVKILESKNRYIPGPGADNPLL